MDNPQNQEKKLQIISQDIIVPYTIRSMYKCM
jgi:hypothetical protein